MRDPERIEPIIACLHSIWAQVPDWRFGQLLSNLLHAMYLENNEADPFFMEDDRFMELANQICKRLGIKEVRATVYAEPWEERCHDCAYLYQGDYGDWRCDHYGNKCKNIKECWNV